MAKKRVKGNKLNSYPLGNTGNFGLAHGRAHFATLVKSVDLRQYKFYSYFNTEGLTVDQLVAVTEEMRKINEENPIKETVTKRPGEVKTESGRLVEEVRAGSVR